MAKLFATKPLNKLIAEAQETGEHTLKRTLGPVNLVMLGIGAIIGAGLFVRTAAAIADRAGPSVVAGVHRRRRWLRLRGPLLRGVRVHDSRSPAAPTPIRTPRWASWSPGSSAGI